METQIIEILLRSTYVLLGIAIVSILGFSILQLFRNVKGSLPSILGILGIGLIFLVAYANTGATGPRGDFGPELINLASSGIIAVYFLGGLAIIGIVLGEIWSSIK